METNNKTYKQWALYKIGYAVLIACMEHLKAVYNMDIIFIVLLFIGIITGLELAYNGFIWLFGKSRIDAIIDKMKLK